MKLTPGVRHLSRAFATEVINTAHAWLLAVLLVCHLQVSGVYWLSRASRDRDARVRTCALNLLTRMLTPRAEPTQRMVASSWPDVPGTLMRTALDSVAAPYGPRTAALRFLCCALAMPASIHGESQAELGRQGG